MTGVTSLIGDIATASSEQSKRINQIDTMVTEIDSVAHQNATLVQASAAAKSILEQQALSLGAIIGRFKMDAETDLVKAADDLLNNRDMASFKEKLRLKNGSVSDCSKR